MNVRTPHHHAVLIVEILREVSSAFVQPVIMSIRADLPALVSHPACIPELKGYLVSNVALTLNGFDNQK